MARRKEKPFDKIMATRTKLQQYLHYGESALHDQNINDFLTDVAECYGYLMDFRNIINGMVSFDETPQQAVVPYLSDDVLTDAADRLSDAA
jgi:hypothetical protein